MTEQDRAVLIRAAKERLLFVAVMIAIIIAIGLMGRMAHAKVVSYGSTAVLARIKPGAPTVCRFPKPVQSVQGASRFEITQQNPDDATYTSFAVTPRVSSGSYPVSFYLNDGTVIQVKFEITSTAAESLYDFAPMGSANGEGAGGGDAPISMSEVELLRAMVLGATPSGYKVSSPNEDMGSKSGARIELIRVYRGSPFNGYVFRATNTNWRKDVEIDVRNISVGDPNLAILAQSDDAVLRPKGKGVSQTLIRVVAKDTSTSRDVVLAMESSASQTETGKDDKNEHH